jgi:hypothetical protein
MMPFDLATAARYGTGPVRLVACMLLIALRDRAERLTLGPDPAPGVIGAEVTCQRSGERYHLVPPPIALLPRVMTLFRQLAAGDQVLLRAGSHELSGRLTIEPGTYAERATIDLPVLPELPAVAAAILDPISDANGLIEFENEEFQ